MAGAAMQRRVGGREMVRTARGLWGLLEQTRSNNSVSGFTFPERPHDNEAPEPAISGERMKVPHSKNHQADGTGFNQAVEKVEGAESSRSLSSIVQLRPALKFRGGGGTEDSSVSNLKKLFRRENAKSSLFPDRESKNSSSIGDLRGPLFQESAKQPSRFSERHARSKAPLARVDHLPVEALDDFEYRVLGSANDEDDSIDDEFLRDLDDIGRSARGITTEEDDNVDIGEDEDWTDDKAKVLTDYALSNMEVFDLEDEENPYRMRPDRLFFPGQTYDPEDLDLSLEASADKPTARTRKKYSSKEVFHVADFRNPRYLSKFIRESSRILPRRHSQISAKAQRKVVREIKTARVLGLMPFTSMGDPPFRFLRSRFEDDANAGVQDY